MPLPTDERRPLLDEATHDNDVGVAATAASVEASMATRRDEPHSAGGSGRAVVAVSGKTTSSSPHGDGDNDANDDDDDFDPDAPAYGVERERYLALIATCLVNGANQLLWATFASIVTPAEEYYDISAQQLNLLNIICPIIYSAGFWLSGMILTRTGLGWGLALCGAANVAVCVLRLMTVWFARSYAMLLAGNALVGVSQMIILCAPPMVSNQWFPQEERGFSTGMGVAAQILGGSIGVLIPSNLVTETSSKQFEILYWIQFGVSALGFILTLWAKKQPNLPPTAAAFKADENVTRRTFIHDHVGGGGGSSPHLRRSDAVVHSNSVGGSPIVSPTTAGEGKRFAVPPQPTAGGDRAINSDIESANPQPPTTIRTTSSARSSSADVRRSLINPHSPEKKRSCGFAIVAAKEILHTVKQIITNYNFVLIVLISGFTFGGIWSAGTLMMQIVQPYNVSQSTVGWIASGTQLGGFFSSMLFGYLMAQYPDFKPTLVVGMLLTAVCTMLFPIVGIIMGDNLTPTIAMVLTGIYYFGLCVVGVAQVPILFELAVEVSFPLSEEITSPLIMWSPSLLSTIAVVLEGMVLTDNPTRPRALITLFINGAMMIVGLGFTMMLRPKYRRREYELQRAGATAAATTGETENGIPTAA